MPHRQPIDELRAGLRQVLSLRSSDAAQPWGNPKAMHEMLLSIQRDLGGQADTKPPEDQVKGSLLQFHKTRELPSFNNLKYVCHGITVPIGMRQWRVIDDQPLFDSLLSEVRKRQIQAKQFRRCYQGLLESYFNFNRNENGSSVTQTNWTGLKSFLADNLNPVLSASSNRMQPPGWLTILAEHRNLLGDDPCSRYAAAFMRDDTSEFRAMCSALGIPGSSWVWEDALMAYVRFVCSSQDEVFKRRMPNLLELVNGKFDMKLPRLLATEAVAVVVSRYSKCEFRPEHADLLTASLDWIGNPWVKRTAWDAIVKNEMARQMVESWLKRYLIRDFFGLLAEDGAADPRRLTYWLNWEPRIDEMWFILGVNALNNRTSAFLDVKKRMEGRDRILRDNNSKNNAFVMRIGQLLVIEFGVTGNACYVFAASDFLGDLSKRTLSIYELKQKIKSEKLSHSGSWEAKFDLRLQHLLYSIPISLGGIQSDLKSKNTEELKVNFSEDAGKPQKFVILSLCGKYGLETEDNRSYGGAFWVLVKSSNPKDFYPALIDKLEKWGFTWSPGKGYWTREEFR